MAIQEVTLWLADASVIFSCDDTSMKITNLKVDNPVEEKNIIITCQTKGWNFKVISKGAMHQPITSVAQPSWSWITNPRTGEEDIGGFEYTVTLGV